MNQSIFNNSNVLCIAETPYQAFVATTLFSMSENRCFKECVLVIYGQFAGSERLASRIAAERVFTEVHHVDRLYEITSRFYGLHNAMESIVRKKRSRESFFEKCPFLAGRTFDILACSGFTRLTLDSKIYVVSDGFSVFFDDGAGSHNGNVFEAFSCHDDVLIRRGDNGGFRRKIRHYANIAVRQMLSSQRFRIEELWLINPTEKDVARYRIPVRPIPFCSNDESLLRVFGTMDKRPKISKLVFLTLSGDASGAALEAEREMLDILVSHNSLDICVKLHPRRNPLDFESCGADVIDPDVTMEALLLCGAITNESTLIGVASTAQLAPKTLVGIEPFLVYTCTMLSGTEFANESTYSIVDEARLAYEKPQKIFAPGSLEDFEKLACRLSG